MKTSEALANAYHILFMFSIGVLAVLIILCLVRAVKGPRIADRIISINMIGTMIISIIAILSAMLDESYLIDVCLIYAMISFLAVIVLAKVYTGVYNEHKVSEEHKKEEADRNGVV